MKAKYAFIPVLYVQAMQTAQSPDALGLISAEHFISDAAALHLLAMVFLIQVKPLMP